MATLLDCICFVMEELELFQPVLSIFLELCAFFHSSLQSEDGEAAHFFCNWQK